MVAPLPPHGDLTNRSPGATRRSLGRPIPTTTPPAADHDHCAAAADHRRPSRTTPVLPGETDRPTRTTETVIYTVTGEGRAINITYVDTGGVMQTEFNVRCRGARRSACLPRRRTRPASPCVNVGRDVTCSVSVTAPRYVSAPGAA